MQDAATLNESTAPVQEPIPVAPIEPTISPAPATPVVVATPPKKSRRLACALIGCILLFVCLILSGIIGYIVYNNVYLPQTAKDYIKATESQFVDVNNSLDDVNKAINDEFGKTGSSGNIDEEIRKVEKAISTANTLDDKVASAVQSIPANNMSVKDLDTALKDYYTSTKDLTDNYKLILQFFKDVLPITKDIGSVLNNFRTPTISSVDDIDQSAQQFRAKAKEYQVLKTKLQSVATNEETKDFQAALVNAVDIYIAYINDTASALEKMAAAARKGSQDDVKKAQSEYDQSEVRFNAGLQNTSKDINTYSDKIDKNYLGKIQSVKDKQTKAQSAFDTAKQKYNIQ